MVRVIIVPMSWQFRSRAHRRRRDQGTPSALGPWPTMVALAMLLMGILLFLSGGRP